MKLDERRERDSVYLIAEMSANHGGSKTRALEIVDAAAEAGADCLKIQTYTADTMTLDSDKPYFRLTRGLWAGYTRYALYKEGAMPWQWQPEIMQRCRQRGIDFLSTVFDFTSVDFLESIGAEAYKIASFELTDIPLIRYAARTGRPMLLSCGMGTRQEIGEAVDAAREEGCGELILLKCTSEYPARPEDMDLSLIRRMAADFNCRTGLSDHSMGDVAALGAVALGARVVEKHFCLSRREKTPDSAFSMEPEEFAAMVRRIRELEAALGSGEYVLTEAEQAGRINRRSVFVSRDTARGEKLTADNVKLVRPAHGLHPREYPAVLGRTAVRDLAAGEPLTEQDYE